MHWWGVGREGSDVSCRACTCGAELARTTRRLSSRSSRRSSRNAGRLSRAALAARPAALGAVAAAPKVVLRKRLHAHAGQLCPPKAFFPTCQCQGKSKDMTDRDTTPALNVSAETMGRRICKEDCTMRGRFIETSESSASLMEYMYLDTVVSQLRGPANRRCSRLLPCSASPPAAASPASLRQQWQRQFRLPTQSILEH